MIFGLGQQMVAVQGTGLAGAVVQGQGQLKDTVPLGGSGGGSGSTGGSTTLSADDDPFLELLAGGLPT